MIKLIYDEGCCGTLWNSAGPPTSYEGSSPETEHGYGDGVKTTGIKPF